MTSQPWLVVDIGPRLPREVIHGLPLASQPPSLLPLPLRFWSRNVDVRAITTILAP
jgi:hypothetical protein